MLNEICSSGYSARLAAACESANIHWNRQIFNLFSTLTKAARAMIVIIIAGMKESTFELKTKLNEVNEASW